MRITITLLINVFFFSISIGQQVDFGKLLVEGINSPSREQQQEIIRKSFSANALATPGIDALEGVLKRWHVEYAPLDYHHSEINEFKKPSGTVYVMHIYARKVGETMYKDFQIYLDTNPPHQLEKIVFIAEVAEPVNLPNGSIEQPETINWLTNYAEKLKVENDLYGSFRIRKGNQILFDQQSGFEDVAKKYPITKNSLFNLASGGKMFTAVAIAQLEEGRKLSYEDPVTLYLTGFPDKAKASKIKIRHLLSHTSGVSEYWSGQTDKAVYSATTINDHLKIVYAAGLDFDAGTQYQYCNSNFILLGAIIEKITRQTFYDYVQKNIFDRAGMTSTGYFEHGSKRVATTLARNEQVYGWQEGRHGMKGSSAGGAYSTLADIEHFSQSLRDNTLIRKETLDLMTSAKNSKLDSSEEYGYGFILRRSGGEFGYGHGGTTDGVNFEFDYFPQQDVTLILFCNQNNGAYDDLKKNMIKLITGDR